MCQVCRVWGGGGNAGLQDATASRQIVAACVAVRSGSYRSLGVFQGTLLRRNPANTQARAADAPRMPMMRGRRKRRS